MYKVLTVELEPPKAVREIQFGLVSNGFGLSISVVPESLRMPMGRALMPVSDELPG